MTELNHMQKYIDIIETMSDDDIVNSKFFQYGDFDGTDGRFEYFYEAYRFDGEQVSIEWLYTNDEFYDYMRNNFEECKNMTNEEIEAFDYDGTYLAEEFTETFDGRKDKLIEALIEYENEYF